MGRATRVQLLRQQPGLFHAIEQIEVTLAICINAEVLRSPIQVLLPEAFFPLSGPDLVFVVQVIEYPACNLVHRSLLLLLSGYERCEFYAWTGKKRGNASRIPARSHGYALFDICTKPLCQASLRNSL